MGWVSPLADHPFEICHPSGHPQVVVSSLLQGSASYEDVLHCHGFLITVSTWWRYVSGLVIHQVTVGEVAVPESQSV